jgi:hypothetical protein
MFCIKCGAQIPDDSSFCPQCGAPVSAENEAVESAAAVEKHNAAEKHAAAENAAAAEEYGAAREPDSDQDRQPGVNEARTAHFDKAKASDLDETQALDLEELVNEEITGPSGTGRKANGDETETISTAEIRRQINDAQESGAAAGEAYAAHRGAAGSGNTAGYGAQNNYGYRTSNGYGTGGRNSSDSIYQNGGWQTGPGYDPYGGAGGYGGGDGCGGTPPYGYNGGAAAARPPFWRSTAGRVVLALIIAAVAAAAGFFVWSYFYSNEVDMFDGIDITYDGADGNGTIQISAYKYDGHNRRIRDFTNDTDNFYFTADKENGLSNDEKVTVTLHYKKTQAKKYGLTITPTSKTYRVSGLSKASSSSQNAGSNASGSSGNTGNRSEAGHTASHSGESYSDYYLYETGYSYRDCPYDEYLWPTSAEYINDEDLEGFSSEDAQAIVNEIFANNGYIFQKKYWYDYFYVDRSEMYGTDPFISSQDKVRENLTEIEETNLETLLDYLN